MDESDVPSGEHLGQVEKLLSMKRSGRYRDTKESDECCEGLIEMLTGRLDCLWPCVGKRC